MKFLRTRGRAFAENGGWSQKMGIKTGSLSDVWQSLFLGFSADDILKWAKRLCRGEYFFFFWKFYPMPNHDIKNSTLASKVMFWTLPLIKCKTHQIWPTLKWKSWFFRFFSSFFTKNPSFPDKFYPSQTNPRNNNQANAWIFCKIFTPA